MLEKIKERLKVLLGPQFYEFISHSKNYVSADVLSKGLGFISIPIFTRLLVPKEYGILGVFTSFVSIAGIVYGLGIRSAVTRYYYEKTDDFDKFYGSNVLLIIIWGFLLTGLLLIFRDFFQDFLKIPLGMIYIGIGTIFSYSFFKIYQSYLQASKQSKKLSSLNILRTASIFIIAIVITVLLKDNRFYGKAIAQLSVTGLFMVISLIAIFRISKLKIEKKYIKYSLLFGVPIVFHLISNNILKQFDQIIINQLIGPEDTGLYSFAYKIGMILNIVAMGMQRAWSPMFYESLNKKNYQDIENLARKYSKIVYLIAFSLILFSREVVMIMAAKEYHTALGVVPIVIIGYIFVYLYTMYVNFAFYHKKTYLIAVFTIIAGGINIGLNYLLIPRFGYIAAAWTTLISYVILFLLHFINIKFIINPEWVTPLKTFIPNFFVLFLGIAIFYLTKVYFENVWSLFLLKIILMTGMTLVLLRKDILKLRKKI